MKAEIELLRDVARKVIEAHECNDLWIDGEHGSSCLSEAHDIALQWAKTFEGEPDA